MLYCFSYEINPPSQSSSSPARPSAEGYVSAGGHEETAVSRPEAELVLVPKDKLQVVKALLAELAETRPKVDEAPWAGLLD